MFVIRSGVCFFILFGLVDTILLSLDLQKRTSYKKTFRVTTLLSNIFASYIQNLEMYFAILVYFWFGLVSVASALQPTGRTSPDILNYRNLKLPHCETIAHQFDWLFSCAVYSPVNLFLTLELS